MSTGRPQNRAITGEELAERGKATRFQKGRSGNPGGRPSLRIFTDELRARLGQRVPEAIAEKWSLPRGITYAAAIAKRLLDQAVDGNVRAVEEIVDRTEGKAPQPIPLTSGDVRIVVRREEPQRKNVVSTARAETQLYDQLVALVKESPNEAVMQAAANLALALKRNGKGKGNGINAATAAAPTFA